MYCHTLNFSLRIVKSLQLCGRRQIAEPHKYYPVCDYFFFYVYFSLFLHLTSLGILYIFPSYGSWDIRSACFAVYNQSFYPFKESLQYFDELKYNESNRIVDTFNKGLRYCIDIGVVELAAGITFLTKFTTNLKAILHLLF